MNPKQFLRFAPYFLLITALCSAALAQKSMPTVTPDVEHLRGHITYLASDALEGRRTGSSGANLAAEYIAKEFSRYGLRRSIGVDLPGMSILEADSPHRYLQEFPYVAGVDLGKNNLFYINTRRADDTVALTVGQDWMPLGFSSNGEIRKAKYVFVGYGITATELKYDDYAGHIMNDTVAIALSGTPDGDNPHGQFARYEDPRWKAIAARNAGAKALFIIASEENFKDDRLARLHYDNSSGEAGLPVAVISMQTAAQLFPSGSPKDVFAALTETAKTKPKPSETPLTPGQDPVVTQAMVNSLPLNGVALSVSIAVARHEVAATNVIGILDGSDPQLKKEVIVIGAHYDHLGKGGEGSLAPRVGEIHHGADDNASGVAGMLELARIFSLQRPRPRHTIVFMAFSGEEEGLLGSNYYVNHPIVPLANTVAMINMDMIGRMKDNKLIVGGIGTAPEWRQEIASANSVERAETPSSGADRPTGQRLNERVNVSIALPSGSNLGTPVSLDSSNFQLTLNEDGFGPSDHSSFYAKQIPVLFFWTGTHDDYHKPSDTADKINYVDEARVVAMVGRIVKDIDNSDKRPTYTVAKSDSTGRSMGFRVYLGTIPNYADSNDGLLLDGVRDDSPATKAGLKAGDKIVKLAGRDVHNVYDYTYALGEMKAGEEYEVEVMRAGERLKLKIVPAARK
jgi:aminopeptidase YwaD